MKKVDYIIIAALMILGVVGVVHEIFTRGSWFVVYPALFIVFALLYKKLVDVERSIINLTKYLQVVIKLTKK